MMKGLFTLLVLGAVSVGVFALGSFRRQSDDKPLLNIAEEIALKVQVSQPKRSEVIRVIQAPGDVEAVLEVDVSSEIVAKIVEMSIEEGDFVKEGDLLCRLDDERLLAEVESGEARVARMKAAISVAESEHEKADRDMKRQIRLSEANVNTVREMADYRTVLKRAAATLEMRKQDLIEMEAALKQLHDILKRTILKSPIDGVISRLNVKQGEVVVTGTMNNPGTVIMSISDLSKMQVRTRVDEIDVPRVKPGQKARIYLQSDQDKPVLGRVVRVASKGSRPTGRDVVTFETLVEVLSDDERIRPGMTANVEIEVARKEQAITIPVEAVVHRLRKDLADDIVEQYDQMQAELDLSERARQAQYVKVLYIMEDEAAHIRIIETGIADSKRVEIVNGITMEDSVIIGPYRSLDQLKDGKKVAMMEEEKKEGKALPDSKGEFKEQQTAENQDKDDSENADSQSAQKAPSDDAEGEGG